MLQAGHSASEAVDRAWRTVRAIGKQLTGREEAFEDDLPTVRLRQGSTPKATTKPQPTNRRCSRLAVPTVPVTPVGYPVVSTRIRSSSSGVRLGNAVP